MSINCPSVETPLHRQEGHNIEMTPITGHVEGRDAVLASFAIDASFCQEVDDREIPFLTSEKEGRRPGLVDRLQRDTPIRQQLRDVQPAVLAADEERRVALGVRPL